MLTLWVCLFCCVCLTFALSLGCFDFGGLELSCCCVSLLLLVACWVLLFGLIVFADLLALLLAVCVRLVVCGYGLVWRFA